MIDSLPEELVYYISEFISLQGIMFVNKEMYEYFHQNMIEKWKTRGRFMVDEVNREKMTVNQENVMNEWIFFSINPGVYRTRLLGEMHDHLFVSIDRFFREREKENGEMWCKAIVEDENGYILRGMIEYEVILFEE